MVKVTLVNIKNASFKFFLLKFGTFLAILFILDFLSGNILRYYYFKQDNGVEYQTTYSIEKTTADILVFGSSRANHHYQPDVFEEGLNLSFYNAGRDGEYIFYHYAILKSVLKRYSPKIIILDISHSEFMKSQERYDRLSSLLPYYETRPEMRPIIEMKSSWEKIKLLSSIYPFNSSIFTIAVGNTKFNKSRNVAFKGYVPLSKKWNMPILKDNDPPNYEIDSAEVSAYKSFIMDCTNSKVKLYVIYSPYFIKFSDKGKSISFAEEIAKNNKIEFLNYANDSNFISNPSLFADPSHLNEIGAKKFSSLIVNDIIKKTTSLLKQTKNPSTQLKYKVNGFSQNYRVDPR